MDIEGRLQFAASDVSPLHILNSTFWIELMWSWVLMHAPFERIKSEIKLLSAKAANKFSCADHGLEDNILEFHACAPGLLDSSCKKLSTSQQVQSAPISDMFILLQRNLAELKTEVFTNG